MNLKEKKQQIQTLLQTKLDQLQKLDNIRNQLSTEVIELRGKLNLINELEKDETEQSKDKSNNTGGRKEEAGREN